MAEFLLALFLFLASHSIPARPTVRRRIAAAIGERTYLTLYSLLSLALLVWLISAASRAPLVPLWDLEPWHYHVPIALMLPALILFVGGMVSPNPLSISFGRGAFDPERPGIVGVTRHPVLWGFALWSGAHVVPNGDLVSVIMFGGFCLFSLAGMKMIDRRKRRSLGAAWEKLAGRTSLLPFGAAISGRTGLAPTHLLLGWTAIGIAAYAALLFLHPLLFGVDPAIVLR
jgi:uncharacterized membrane protein